MTSLLLIRHGETFANRFNYIQGTLDNEMTSLTARGLYEAKRYQALVQSEQIDRVYTSPLKRAVQTSQIICDKSSLTVWADQRLTEVSYGKWNGMAIQHLKTKYADYFDTATNDVRSFSTVISHGESFKHAQTRLKSFIGDVLAKCPHGTVLVVTHGWIIKNMISLYVPQIDGTTFRNPRNLSISRIEIDEQLRKRICYYNWPIERVLRP